MELPKEEYIHVEENGRKVTYCTMRQKVLHTIGLNSNHTSEGCIHGMERNTTSPTETISAEMEMTRIWINWLKLVTWSVHLKSLMEKRPIHIDSTGMVLTGLESNWKL